LQLHRTLGVELSHDTISRITDSVLEDVRAWHTRLRVPGPVYPVA
jgi:putative transposase